MKPSILDTQFNGFRPIKYSLVVMTTFLLLLSMIKDSDTADKRCGTHQ